jgi:hypothetical protein
MILEAIRIWTAVLDGEMATTFRRRMVIDAEQYLDEGVRTTDLVQTRRPQVFSASPPQTTTTLTAKDEGLKGAE